MAKPYELGNADKKQPAVIQSLKPGAEAPFSAKEVSFLQASEAQKKGEWRLAVWCEDISLAKARAKDLNARACIGERTQPELPKKEEPGAPVKQLADVKVDKPGTPKKAKELKGALGDDMVPAKGREGFLPRALLAVEGVLDECWPRLADSVDPDLISALSELQGALAKIAGAAEKVSGSKPRFAAALIQKPLTVEAGILQNYVVPKGHDFYCSNCGDDMDPGDTVFSYRPYVDKKNDGYPHYCSQEHAVTSREAGSDTSLESQEAADPHGEAWGGQAVEGAKVKAEYTGACSGCGKNVGSANITMSGHSGKKFCSQACVDKAYADLHPKDKKKVADAGDKHGMAGEMKTAAGKRRAARMQATLGPGGWGPKADPGAVSKAQNEMQAIVRKIKAKVARYGLQESMGQNEVRKFHDACMAGKFGKMEYTQAAKLEEELRNLVEAIEM